MREPITKPEDRLAAVAAATADAIAAEPRRAFRRWSPLLMTVLALASLEVLCERRWPVTFPSQTALFDLLYNSRARATADPIQPIVIVRFDDTTVIRLATTWARFTALHTRLIDVLTAGGARVIGFDLGLGFLEATAQGRAFIDSSRRSGRVVVASQLPTRREPVLPLAREVRTLPGLAQLDSGFANFCVDPVAGRHANRGGVIRAASVASSADGRIVPSLATRLVQRYRGETRGLGFSAERLSLGSRSVGLEQGLLRIDYPGPEFFPTVAYESVVDGKVPAALFRDRIVLVGSYAQTLRDSHRTPFGEMPGVVIQASIVHTLLSERPMARAPSPIGPLLTLLMGLAVGPIRSRRGSRLALAAGIGLPVALFLGCSLAFRAGWLVPGLFAMVAGPACLVASPREEERRAVAHPEQPATQVPATAMLPVGESAVDMVVAVARQVIAHRYRDGRLLGRGGMGVVLCAWDSVLEKTVAVKVLSPLLVDRPEVLRRFLREIRALQELEHPGVVKILDVGEQGVNPYYAMEFLEGRDLGDLIRAESPLPLSRTGGICRQLFETLAHVHRRGIVHRDVKPPNILLLEGDRVKLLDFGLAHVPEASTMTADGEILGTLRYMSPEQMNGHPIGPASDVFSAALVAYELLTGAMPYPEMGKVLNIAAPRIPLAQRRPDTPSELSELLLKMLDPDPDRRWTDWDRIVATWSAAIGDRSASEFTGGFSA